MNMNEEFLWSQKYRPKTIEECILPESIKSTFKNFIASGQIPNFLLNGKAGTGKTTCAYALCNEIGADVMFINASNETGVDVIRTKITQFASNKSFDYNLKVVILDEADRGSAAFQDCLKTFMETFSKTTRFILTTNTKGNIITPIHSRCNVIDFIIKKDEMQHLQGKLFSRIKVILKENNIKFEPAAVAELVKKFYPDNRRILNELQMYSSSGIIDVGILNALSNESIKELVGYLKTKNFKDIRAWVATNGADEPHFLFHYLYEHAYTLLEKKSIPEMILILAKYSESSSVAVDHEINNLACFIELMTSCEFL